MEVETSLAQGVRAAGRNPRYDEACKRLLSERQVLARIMQGCLREYEGVPVDEVIACIEGDPQVGAEPVERDADAARIAGLPTEDSTLAEGAAFFDVLFDAAVPGTGEQGVVRLVVNVEAQGDFDPGYPLVSRAVYYCGRLLSRQGAAEVAGSHYERVRKVCSVWVCMTPNKEYRRTVSRFSLSHEQLVGAAPYGRADWDLVEVVMIGLDPSAGPGVGDGGELLGFLGTIFSGDATPQERIESLCNDFGVAVTKEIADEVGEMCNLSEGVWRRGLEEGLARGEARGEARATLGAIASVMEGFSVSAERAMDVLGVPQADRAGYAERLGRAGA